MDKIVARTAAGFINGEMQRSHDADQLVVSRLNRIVGERLRVRVLKEMEKEEKVQTLNSSVDSSPVSEKSVKVIINEPLRRH